MCHHIDIPDFLPVIGGYGFSTRRKDSGVGTEQVDVAELIQCLPYQISHFIFIAHIAANTKRCGLRGYVTDSSVDTGLIYIGDHYYPGAFSGKSLAESLTNTAGSTCNDDHFVLY